MYIVLLLLLVHTLPIASSLSTSNILHFVRFTKKLHEDHYSIKLFINLKRNVQSFFINLKRMYNLSSAYKEWENTVFRSFQIRAKNPTCPFIYPYQISMLSCHRSSKIMDFSLRNGNGLLSAK